jgi:hypothetical protein
MKGIPQSCLIIMLLHTYLYLIITCFTHVCSIMRHTDIPKVLHMFFISIPCRRTARLLQGENVSERHTAQLPYFCIHLFSYCIIYYKNACFTVPMFSYMMPVLPLYTSFVGIMFFALLKGSKGCMPKFYISRCRHFCIIKKLYLLIIVPLLSFVTSCYHQKLWRYSDNTRKYKLNL